MLLLWHDLQSPIVQARLYFKVQVIFDTFVANLLHVEISASNTSFEFGLLPSDISNVFYKPILQLKACNIRILHICLWSHTHMMYVLMIFG